MRTALPVSELWSSDSSCSEAKYSSALGRVPVSPIKLRLSEVGYPSVEQAATPNHEGVLPSQGAVVTTPELSHAQAA